MSHHIESYLITHHIGSARTSSPPITNRVTSHPLISHNISCRIKSHRVISHNKSYQIASNLITPRRPDVSNVTYHNHRHALVWQIRPIVMCQIWHITGVWCVRCDLSQGLMFHIWSAICARYAFSVRLAFVIGQIWTVMCQIWHITGGMMCQMWPITLEVCQYSSELQSCYSSQ